MLIYYYLQYSIIKDITKVIKMNKKAQKEWIARVIKKVKNNGELLQTLGNDSYYYEKQSLTYFIIHCDNEISEIDKENIPYIGFNPA